MSTAMSVSARTSGALSPRSPSPHSPTPPSPPGPDAADGRWRRVQVSLHDAFTQGIGHVAAALSAPLRQRIFVPLNKAAQVPVEAPSRAEVLQAIGGAETVSIVTQDGVKLDAVWAAPPTPAGPVALIFHGNACVLDSMVDYGAWYRAHGFGVMMITMRGYPGSAGDACDGTEAGMYRDAAAAMNYVLQHTETPTARIVAHGYSLGGVLAAAVGKLFDVHVVLDHTFTTPAAVMRHVRAAHAAYVPAFVVSACAWSMFEKNAPMEVEVYDRASQSLRTLHAMRDGLDNGAKVKALKGDLFVLYGAADPVMAVTFAEELYSNRYGPCPEEPSERVMYVARRARFVARLGGGHWEVLGEDRRAAATFERFLRDQCIVAA